MLIFLFLFLDQVGHNYLIHVQKRVLLYWLRECDYMFLTEWQFLCLSIRQPLKNQERCFIFQKMTRKLNRLSSEQRLNQSSRRHSMLFHHLEDKQIRFFFLVNFWSNHGWWKWFVLCFFFLFFNEFNHSRNFIFIQV